MKLTSDELRKLQARDVPEQSFEAGQQLQAILRVREPGYLPAGVRLRSRIDDKLFTAEFPASLLDSLRQDERIASVELNQPLRRID